MYCMIDAPMWHMADSGYAIVTGLLLASYTRGADAPRAMPAAAGRDVAHQ